LGTSAPLENACLTYARLGKASVAYPLGFARRGVRCHKKGVDAHGRVVPNLRARLTALSLIVLVAVESSAPAGASELDIAEPNPCADGEELSFLAERALGQPLASVSGPNLDVRIRREGRRYAARVKASDPDLGGAHGVRDVSASSCRELLDTLAVAIAITLGSVHEPEPSTTADDPEPRVIESPPPPPSSSVRPDEIPKSTPESGSNAPAIGVLGGALLDGGSVPGLGLGLGLGAELEWHTLELRMLGLWLPERSSPADAFSPPLRSHLADEWQRLYRV
jgi:hypothetical protein